MTPHIPAHHRRAQTNFKKPLVLSGVLALIGGVVAAVTVGTSSASARERLVGIYTGNERPTISSARDSNAAEVGVQFSVSTPGSVLAIRFYKGSGNTGRHTGSLWTTGGQRVTTVTFTGESRRGWQVARLARPVALTPGTTYVASYHTDAGHYAIQDSAFANHATIGNSTIRGTGSAYRPGAGFPSQTGGTSGYYVDVLFQPGRAGTPITQSPTATPPTTRTPTPTLTTTPTTTHPAPTPTTTKPTATPTTTTPGTTTAPPPITSTAGQPSAECAKGGSYLWTHLEACGYAGPANTGPATSQCAGGQLTTNSGSTSRIIRVTAANTTISCENITGCLSVEAPNVTISNVQIACTSGKTGEAANGTGVIKIQDGASANISHVAIDGMSGVHACIWHQGTSMTATAVNCHGVDDGIFSWADTGYSPTTGDNFTIKDSYIHDLTSKTANGHIDGYQTEGAANGVISHNTFYMTSDNGNSTNSAIAIWNALRNSHDISVSNNLIAGGGFAVYAEDYSPSEANPSGGFTVTNITFTGNKFSTVLFGCIGYYGVWFSRGNPSDHWNRSGNTVLETGANVDAGNPTSGGRACV